MPQCTVCGYYDETDAEFDWSRTICDGCAEKGWTVLKSDIDEDRKDRFVSSSIGLTIRAPDGKTFEIVEGTNGEAMKDEKKWNDTLT